MLKSFLEKLKSENYLLYISVILLLLFRLLLTANIPLLDKTEARYAEISRIMYETKEWVVVQIDYGVPFWAKPPLSTWLSAASFVVFGVNEFAARFPSYLLSVLILIIAGKFAKKKGLSFYLPGFILLSTPEFLIHTGVVSTDSALSFSITLMMLSFWQMMNNPLKTVWNYLFFVGLGLGLLAKGPLIMVLSFPPLFVWCCLDINRFKELFRRLPIILGIVITIAIALPWYYLVEQKSPGFSEYFFVGEHYKRFMVPGWKGDLYGNPKSVMPGMVWVFMLAFSFPWFQIVLYKLWKNRTSIVKDSWVSFLVLWMFWLPVFFTMSKNILHTYTLPVTIPMMFLMVHYWEDFKSKKTLLRTGLFFPVAVFIAYVGLQFYPKTKYQTNSDKYMLENLDTKGKNKDIPLYYYVKVDNNSQLNKEKNYSGEFYSDGKAQIVKNFNELDSVFKIHPRIILATPKKEEKNIPKKYLDQMLLKESNYKTAIFMSK